MLLGFPGGSEGKASACNEGDPGSILGSGRSPGEGNGNPLQYSWLVQSKGSSRQAYWSGLPCPPPGHLPNPGFKPASLLSPALQVDSLLLSHRASHIQALLLSHFSCVRLCATPWRAAHQVPPSLGFSGKNTGVGCHCLLQCRKVKSESEVAQSCPTLSDPMDCSLPGSSVHGIYI